MRSILLLPLLMLACATSARAHPYTGLVPPGAPCPNFSVALGNPMQLEPLLKRHPKLRVWLMHAGWPYLQETKAILYMYPQVHADVAVINWIIPRAEFHRYLQSLLTAGFGDRLMFGPDQMVWPEAIGQAIEGVDSAPFLDAKQKRDLPRQRGTLPQAGAGAVSEAHPGRFQSNDTCGSGVNRDEASVVSTSRLTLLPQGLRGAPGRRTGDQPSAGFSVRSTDLSSLAAMPTLRPARLATT